MSSLIARLRTLLRRRHLDRELDDELRFHLEMQTRANLERGLPADEARRQTLLAFGGVDRVREGSRDLWALPLDDLRRDARHAVRLMARQRAVTVAAVVTLAIGIGGNTAVFSVLDAALLRPLPVDAPERLVLVQQEVPSGSASTSFSYPVFLQLRDRPPGLSGLAAVAPVAHTVRAAGIDEQVDLELVSTNYFSLLGLRPLVGRFFHPDEGDALGGGAVCVLSEAYWRQRFQADRGVLGRPIVVQGVPVTVVGVAPARFDGIVRGDAVAAWAPITMYSRFESGGVVAGDADPHEIFRSTGWNWLYLVGRLQAGASPAQARAALTTRAALFSGFTQNTRRLPSLQLHPLDGLTESRVETLTRPLVVLMAAVSLLLLLACANVANLLLSRAAARRMEMALRLSLGATRRRIVRQMLVENVILALLGGGLGVLFAEALNGVLAGLQSAGSTPLMLDVRLDGRVLGFTLIVSLATAVLCGLVPALRVSRPALLPSLRDGGPTVVSGRRAFGLRHALVAFQVAVSLVLLVGGALLLRSFVNLQNAPLGFDPERVLTASFTVPDRFMSGDNGIALCQQILERLRALPGVASASLASRVPVGPLAGTMGGLVAPGATGRAAGGLELPFNVVFPDFFRTLGVRTVRGRTFRDTDTVGPSRRVVVNEALARWCWPGQDPLGQRIVKRGVVMEVIGVVEDFRATSVSAPVRPTLFLDRIHPFGRTIDNRQTIVVRTTNPDPMHVAPAVQQTVRSVESSLTVLAPMRLTDRIDRVLALPRTTMQVVGVFGVLALLMAVVGLYGVLAYAVAERTREIGVRIALGAGRRAVVIMVMRSASAMLALGLAAGLAAALGLGRLVASLLYGVTPADPLAIATVGVALAAAGLAAAYVPARRAASIDATQALRSE